jgi:uncharacterized integral membrane protein (TIGR00698 family)
LRRRIVVRVGIATRQPVGMTAAGRPPAAVPGLVLAFAAALIGYGVHELFATVSPHVVAVVLGVVAANTGIVRARHRRGLRLAAKRVLRIGIVLVGFRLSLSEVRDLGPRALIAVCIVVAITFTGTRWLGRRLGLSSSLSLLVATGYSICGASAIAAAEPFADATEEEVAYSIALVTLCGSLAIAVLPPLGALFGMSSHDFGAWVGASVHDVGQVVAAASTRDALALKAAVIVKLTRVALLAPLLMGIAVESRRRAVGPAATTTTTTTMTGTTNATATTTTKRPPLLPLFVALFLAAVVVRTVFDIPRRGLNATQTAETILLGAGLFGLGSGVDIGRLRRLGGRPLALGLISWVLVAATALAAVTLLA